MEQPDSPPERLFEEATRALAGRLSRAALEELEDHLWCAFDAERELGSEPTVAARAALESLGPLPELVTEYHKQNAMNSSSRLLGISFSLAAVVLAIIPSTSLGSYLDIPSALLVGGLVLGGLLASFGPVAMLRTLRQALAREAKPGRDVSASLRLARHGYRLSWASGAVGVLVGTINMLTNLGDPSQLGGGLALAILSLLYGALLAELGFSNLGQWLERSADPSSLALDAH